MTLEISLPRYIDHAGLFENPLHFLHVAHYSSGNAVVVLEGRALFSRAFECEGVIAVFGPRNVRQVLSDTDTFRMPMSVTERFSLPSSLTKLTRGLFSMHGEEHRTHQLLLKQPLGRQAIKNYDAMICNGWEAFERALRADHSVSLLAEMRRLMMNISGQILFGNTYPGLSEKIQAQFDQRREFCSMQETSAPNASSHMQARRALIRNGIQLRELMHATVRDIRNYTNCRAGQPACIISRLAEMKNLDGTSLKDDELVSHAIVLSTSSSEPLSVALTWILLLLSQNPAMLVELRNELKTGFINNSPSKCLEEDQALLLRGVIMESLRLLPPNAIMVRLTSKSSELQGHRIPKDCEVILSPYIEHRDGSVFRDPDVFMPKRWQHLNPSPYSYLPFGAGSRYCLGKYLAYSILISAIARIIEKYDVVLRPKQVIDWKIDVTLMPINDIVVQFMPRNASARDWGAGHLGGSVMNLIHNR